MDHRVIAFALAAASPPESAARDGVAAWIDEWWRVAGGAGLTEPADGLPLDPPAIDSADDQWLALLSGRRNPCGDSSAVVVRAHDVVGVLVSLASTDAPASALARLPAPDPTGRPASVFGGARFVVTSHPQPGALEPGDVLESFGVTEPGPRFGAVTEDGVLIAEAETDPTRTFAIVVPSTSAELADQLTGLVPGPDLGSLLRYVVHAAKLRYLIGVFQTELPDLRARADRSDEWLRELFRLHASLEGERGRLDRSLFDAHSRLSRAHNEAAGLAVVATRVQDLARSSRTAAHNLRIHTPPLQRAVGPNGTTSFDRDAELARWLDDAIEQELGYLTSARERAAEAQELTRLRVQQATEEQARLGNWLTVVQTSVLAAVLGCLGVVSAFSIEPDPDLRWPVLVTVPLLSLALPLLALRWVSGLGWFDVVLAGACGAAVGWTAAVAAELADAVVLAVVGFGVVVGTAVAYERRQRQAAPRA